MSVRHLRAVIFDMDGTLWDGEPLFLEAFNVVLTPLGHRVTEEEYTKIIGLSVEAAWKWVLERFDLSESPIPMLGLNRCEVPIQALRKSNRINLQ